MILILEGALTDELPPFPGDILVGMANNMTLPIDWNVQFQSQTAGGEERSLYVHRYVLSARSNYYKTSSIPPLNLLILVFQSSFIEGASATAGDRPVGQIIQTLPSHEPFEVLHPILYYLYTDLICFTTVPIEEAKPYHQVPPCAPEDAYRVGDLFDLEQLKKKALGFLVDTADMTNIISRIFGDYALKYQEIGQGYETVFYKYWNDVKKTGALSQYFRDLEGEEDVEGNRQAIRRCMELMEGLTSQGVRSV